VYLRNDSNRTLYEEFHYLVKGAIMFMLILKIRKKVLYIQEKLWIITTYSKPWLYQ